MDPSAQPGGAEVPIPERSIISGENSQFRKMRRHARLSQSENSGEECLGSSVEASGSYGHSPNLKGGSYQRRGFGSGNKLLSSSPRSPNTRGFHSKRHPAQHLDQEGQPVIVKSSGTPHRQYSRGRNRSSSETEKGDKERVPRKRGRSETEYRPKWDNTNMSGLQCLASERIWFDKNRYDEAERRFYEGANGPSAQQQQVKTAMQAKGRQHKRSHRNSSSHGGDAELVARMKSLELENQTLHKVVGDMKAALQKLESRVAMLEKSPAPAAVPAAKAAPAPAKPAQNGDEDDDDFDLFGSDEEDDEEAERLKEERIAAYAAKKSKKPALIAKSSILLDVKPWDDETDMVQLEAAVRSVQMDGLLWGASKLLPVGYGIKKLQINCVVEDDKVGTDILEEEIVKFEDLVQSVDVAAFNKI
ncbi:elongation factor 1-delta-like isoform X3 [Synchiropus splendidus]|uniref:elongation factor 1-delta-like isoform X3 n=1 Tax=Synchiropus splendidus TaxID=270530 RepID=UPI00237E1FBB|nr:elongation factor 1-delta-like isoform X3 [Synchiropus splendidus]